MHITVDIKNHVPGKTVYHPGDPIHGSVTVTGPVNDRSLKILATLRGTSTITKQNGKRTSKTTNILCQAQKVIFEKPCRIRSGENVVAYFDMILPKKTMPCEFSILSERVWMDMPHSLPPTTEAKDGVASCSIAYGLEIEVKKSPPFPWTKKVWEPLIVRRDNPTWLPLQPSFKKMSHLIARPLKPEYRPKWQAVGTKQKEEESGTIVRVEVPQIMFLNSTTPLWLQFTHDFELSPADIVPEVRLLSIKHTIWSRHFFRRPSLMSFLRPTLTQSFHADDKIELQWTAKDDGLKLIENEFFDIGSVMGNQLSEENHTGTFRSYTVVRKYGSQTEIEISVAGKLIDPIVFVNWDLTVFPRILKKIQFERSSSFRMR